MDMDVYSNYVVQIVTAGSLTKAAEILGVSQPALSLGLNKLEKELGFKIFNRRTIPLRLTDEGKIYYDYIQRIRVLHKDFQLRISTLRDEFNSKVVIGGPEIYIGGIVTSAVCRLLELHPDFSVRIKSASINQLISLIANREIDCFISTTDNLPPDLEKMPIKKEKLFLCVPKKNPINKKLNTYYNKTGNTEPQIDFSCLSREEFIYLEEWQPLQKILQSFFKQYTIKPTNRIVVNQVSSLLNLSIANNALCIAAEDALITNGNAEQFCLYLLPETISNRLIYVAYDKDLCVSQATCELIRFLKEEGGFSK